jgi:D-arabinose 1-dehydrogenase-like Zn-dependent alcohol dehydrogenase
VTCGATTGYDAKLDLRFLFTRQLSIMGSYMGTKSELRTVLKLVAQGRLKPWVDKVFDLGDCMVAHNYLEQAKQFGKVVLRVE